MIGAKEFRRIVMRRLLLTLPLVAVLGVPATSIAGKGASYSSLKNAIGSKSPDSIVAEIERAEKLPCGSCIDLVMPLIDHDNGRVRDVAAWWLAKRAVRTQVRDDMFVRLHSGDTIAARNAAEVLGRFLHPDALMALEIAIHDDSLGAEARAAATRAVGVIGHPAGKAILEGALTSSSVEVRRAAAQGLRDIRGNVDALMLVDRLQDSDPEVVEQAVLTIGAVREGAAVDNLVDLVTDPDQPARVRKFAAWALGRAGDRGVRDVLADVAREDADMLVRGAARSAYNSL
jgi:HEAT repeat protein